MSKGSESIFDKIWKLVTSLRLAIPIIIIVAVASIFGTIVEQNQSIEVYRRFLGESTIQIFSKMGLFDMYHSWWFLLLLVLFIINLSCCTIERLPNVIKIIKNPKKLLTGNMEKGFSLTHKWKEKGDIEEIKAKYSEQLGGAFGKPESTSDSDTTHLYAEKGAYSRFGVYITHTSILIILIGAIIGNVWGFKGFVNIVEGTEVTSVPRRGSMERVNLGFSLKCTRFWIENYPNGSPKEYFSDLVVIDGGKVVKKERIEVNSPLRYKGIWFYQASYGPAGASNITLDVRKKDGSIFKTLTLSANKEFPLTEVGTVVALDYSQNFQGFGPAILLSLKGKEGKESKFWIFKNFPEFDKRRGGTYYMSFTGIDTIYYTGLQVARDPGVNVVWLGCALMVIGLLTAFFGSHRRVWLRITPLGEGKTELVLAGSANKNRLAFEKVFAKIKEKVTKN